MTPRGSEASVESRAAPYVGRVWALAGEGGAGGKVNDRVQRRPPVAQRAMGVSWNDLWGHVILLPTTVPFKNLFAVATPHRPAVCVREGMLSLPALHEPSTGLPQKPLR